MPSINDTINEGVAFLQQGRAPEAVTLYRRVLQRYPRHADAMHLLSVAQFQSGQAEQAVATARKAISINPKAADYHSNLARYLLSLGQLEEALREAEAALASAPTHAAARFNAGTVLAQLGRHEAAMAQLSEYCRLAPNDPGGHHLLGSVYAELHRHSEAAASFQRAIAANPGIAEPHNNLGNSLQALGRAADSIPHYEQALRIRPHYPDAMSNLGAAYQALDRLAEAEVCYRKALEMEPGMLQARGNLANLLGARGQHREAVAAFESMVAEVPNSVESWNNLGNNLQELGWYDRAVAAYRHALEINPGYFVVRNNIANTMRRQGRYVEALAEYDRALAANPEFVEAINNKAVTLQQMGRGAEAMALFEKAITVRPDYADPMINLANYWRDHGRAEEAIALLGRARELQPGNPYIWNNLGCVLSDQGQPREAIESFRRALALQPSKFQSHSNILLNLHYLDDTNPVELAREHRRFAAQHEAPIAPPARVFANAPQPGRPLRIGYVSADFRRHSVAFFIEPLLERHDRAGYVPYCYSDVARPDSHTARFEEIVGNGWRDIRGCNHESFAARVREDEIDILVDLGGHTANSRVLSFALKPAPIQVTYLGYPNTTGMSAFDYRFTDPWADPAGLTESLHTEKLYRLPSGFLCFRPPAETPDPAPMPSVGGQPFTFGSFNNFAKVSDACVRAWARILARVPGSRLLLKNRALSETEARNRAIQRFAAHGIGAERLLLSGLVASLYGHLDSYRVVDMALDTFPYAGTTTTFEALWMGVAVVTLPGLTHASRTGASILSIIGLPGFIAASEDGYVERAVKLATGGDTLFELRRELRERMRRSPLTDETGFARSVEAAYREMWKQWCVGQGGER